MHEMQLSAINLNLLAVLHALVEERNVLRAGRRIGLSPSATSHALARLRELLRDPILVRAGRQLVLTPRGEALADPVRRLLGDVEQLIRPSGEITPSELVRSFRISTTDHVRQIFLAELDGVVRRDAPGVDLHFVAFGPTSLAELREGRHDFVIAVFGELAPDLRSVPLFEDRLVSVVRSGHPLLRKRPTLEAFAAAEHVLVAPNGKPGGLMDDLLAKRGLTRRVARLLPTFTDAPFFVARTNYVLTMPEGFLRLFEKKLRLKRLKLPLELPRFTHRLVYHQKFEVDPEHVWFRATVSRLKTISRR
jgi:DNA-binding transcriptional LysR family regulator